MTTDHIARRRFMRAATGTAFLASAGRVIGGASTIRPETHFETRADVLVVGGGTAGTVAAIQAGRAGAQTVLVERGSQLGGTMTVGGVAFPGLFDAWGRQIIAGIGWELVKKTVAADGGSFPDFSTVPRRHWQNQVLVNQFLYALIAEEACLKAGVQIAYYECPAAVKKTGGGWMVTTVGAGVRRTIACRQIVDCTGGADVVGMLGLDRLRGKETQPGSMLFRAGAGYRPGRERLQAVYVHGADSSTAATRTAANLAGRKAVLAAIREKKTRIQHLQPEAAFRESYRIVGETVITVDDYTAGRVFDDALCYAFYPVDLHTRSGVKPKPLTKGTVPTVPFGALIPKGSTDIIVAGRCVSSDRLANSGLRVQAPCMAMGQAAGAAAALAAQRQTTPLKVPLEAIRALLGTHGAIVPGTKG